MSDLTFFELYYNDSSNPCCLADMETYELVFINRSMVKLLKDYRDYQDKKCYEMVYHRSSPCEFCNNDALVSDEFVENYIYNDIIGKHFRVNNTLVHYKGRKLNLCKYFITPSYSNQILSFEEAMAKCAEILDQPKVETMISSFLKLLGQFYQCDKSYIFQFDKKNNSLKNLNLWSHNDDHNLNMEVSDPKLLAGLLEKLSEENHSGVVELTELIRNFSQTSSEAKRVNDYGIKNLVLCPMYGQNDEIVGFVGIVNGSELEKDYRLLKSITHFVEESFNKSTMMDELNAMSEQDLLTGFGSRNKYVKRLSNLSKETPKSLGVVFVNVNGLRKTNELLGSEQGDTLIRQSALTLQEYFHEEFYRVSGDEFVAFVENCTQDDFNTRMDQLQENIKNMEQQMFALGHSWKQGHIDVAKLVAEADTIMYINKQDYYHLTHRLSQDVKHSVLQEVLQAVENEEFVVYLQPQINLKENSVTGAEALVRRFDKKEQKMIFPDQFIPLYEQNSVIRHVDLFVLDKVCQLIAQWTTYNKRIPISVNLSRVTLMEHNIVKTISKICDKHLVPHEYIVIEVTERVGLIENDVASTLIHSFKKLGFKISLDDFGCAYSNIITLAQIEFDEVKLDKSLVDNLLTSDKNKVIVENVLRMCNGLQGTETLAEGIELEEQATILNYYGCNSAQGYLYSRPIPHEDFFEKYIACTTPVVLETLP